MNKKQKLIPVALTTMLVAANISLVQDKNVEAVKVTSNNMTVNYNVEDFKKIMNKGKEGKSLVFEVTAKKNYSIKEVIVYKNDKIISNTKSGGTNKEVAKILINENGTYKFVAINNKGKKLQRIVKITNFDTQAPKLTYKINSKGVITVKATDDKGIASILYNGSGKLYAKNSPKSKSVTFKKDKNSKSHTITVKDVTGKETKIKF